MSYLGNEDRDEYTIKAKDYLPSIIVVENAFTLDPSKYEYNNFDHWQIIWVQERGNGNVTFYHAIPCQQLINSWDIPQGEKHALIAEIEAPSLQLCPEID